MTSTTRDYFDSLYFHDDDPWDFATSDYERRKYALTVASLPRVRYDNGFEPGCSIGVLTELLAPRCGQLLATDMISAPLAKATSRLRPYRHVRVEQGAIPFDWPDGRFDLIVLSEVAYYFDEERLREILERIVDSTSVEANIVGVHWRGETDYPLSGDIAHAIIDRTSSLGRIVHHVEDAFVLDVWERKP